MSEEEKKRLEKIIMLIKQGRIEEALKLTNADDVESLLNIGTLFGLRGANDIAEKIFDRVTQLKPNDDRAWNNKGIALVRLGRLEAVKCYDEAIRINPDLARR
jgi:Flp pilus assembly protein TadD